MNQRATITDRILMIRPAAFGYNPETADNNAFQQMPNLSSESIHSQAIHEFDLFVKKLRNHRIHVDVIEDRLDPKTPDAIFPNNWISLHGDGTIITYPMFSPLRRHERREDVIQYLAQMYKVSSRISYEQYEIGGLFLEGTGSLVLDRAHKIAYACRSSRTHEVLVDEFCNDRNYHKIIFNALDEGGVPIYHTNVIMAVAETFAVVCLSSIPAGDEKTRFIESLQTTGKKIIDIDFDQARCYAGNMLQVRNQDEVRYTIMSEAAFLSLRSEQLAIIMENSFTLHAAIPIIEQVGGGSVRCMMAENFLPPKVA